MKVNDQPIIIIGMHRSGTSLVAKLLSELGLFIGCDVGELSESKYFYDINESLLLASNAQWDNPEPIDNLLNHSGMRKKVIASIRDDLHSFRTLSYLGLRRFARFKSVIDLNISWGWKDPRNTYLLPIWLEVFPRLKIIHIYRNGIDVARSLAFRESKRIENIIQGIENDRNNVLKSRKTTIQEAEIVGYFLERLQVIYRHINPLKRYKELGVKSCISVKNGFNLWSAYTQRAFENIENTNNEFINIKYEDFLISPKQYMMKLADFCGLPAHEKRIEAAVRKVNSTRRYAFVNNNELLEFYHTVKDTYLMRRLGYNASGIASFTKIKI